jgi:hypothetical protein
MEEMKNEAETSSMVSMTLYAVMYPVFNEVGLLLMHRCCIASSVFIAIFCNIHIPFGMTRQM